VIALDTNVVVRFMVEDDREQSERTRDMLDRADREGQLCLVTDIVVCELVWVLESCYRFDRSQIAAALRMLLRARQLRFQSPDLVARAIERYGRGRGDVSDYLIDEVGRVLGCESTATFDRALLGEKRFSSP
jgi:predicted nucleic-acid-binding protein